MAKPAQRTHFESAEYPMIPIRDVVIFPHSRVAFKIGRRRSIAALKIALASDRKLFLVTQRDAEIENPGRDQVYDIGTVADLEHAELKGEQYHVVVKGRSRATLVEVANRRGAHFALVRPIAAISDIGKPVTPLMQHVGKLIQDGLPIIAEPVRSQIKAKLNTSNPSMLSDSITCLLPLVSIEDKQSLLETLSPFERLLRIAGLLERKEIKFQLSKGKGSSIFIGHGRSPLWARLQVFLQNDLKLTTLNYETESRVGDSIVPILERMLDESGFAVLVLTAEDQTESGKRARQNVIHEAGLFQGRLGFKKAILLVQDGIEDFSNVAGLQHIRFSGDHIEQTFYDLERVLKREGLI
jgi:Lon protease-like protein